jgi:cation transport ATPase
MAMAIDNESMISGEPIPVDKKRTILLAGTINGNKSFKLDGEINMCRLVNTCLRE